MIGSLPPGAIIAANLTRQQEAPQPFVWGGGGRRMTPDEIARQRDIAAGQMQADYSPVGHWTQGLARVADNLSGAIRERRANKAADANIAHSERIRAALSGGGSPPATALPGVSPSSAPGSSPEMLMQVLADPYADDGVKALAQMQIEQQNRVALKEMEWANREQPEIVQLARLANDPTQPEHVRAAANGRMQILNDPMAIIPGLPIGTYVGPQSGVAAALGGGSSGPKVGDVVDGHRYLGGDPNSQSSWQAVGPPPISEAPARVSEKDAAAALAKARTEGDEWMRRNMEGGR